MFDSGDADGWDGYYYVMQLDSWQRYGHLHSANYSLIYLPLLLIGSFTSALLSYQLTVWFISCMFFFGVVKLFDKEVPRIKIALALCVLALSPHLLFFSLQFPKMLLGMIFLMFGLRMLKENKWKWVVVFLILIFLSHRAVFGFALLFIPFFLRLERRRVLIFASGMLLVVVVLALNIPGLPRFSDVSRVSGHFSISIYWGILKFYSLWDIFGSKAWLFEFVLIHGLLLVIIVTIIQNISNRRFLLILPALMLVLPIMQYDAGSIGYRLHLLGVVSILIIGVMLLSRHKFALLISSIVLIITNATSSYFPEKFNPPFGHYRSIAQKAKFELIGTKVDLIVAHKGLKEQVLLESDLNALNWSPDTITPNTFRILTGVPIFILKQNLSVDQLVAVKDLGYNYYLIPEVLFDEHLRQYLLQSQAKYPNMEWLNPIELRPTYLR